MPPDTSVSDEQITTLFRHHGLTSSPKMNRIMAGFTNEIHQVDDYILKICVRENHLDKFQNEAWLYRALQGKVPVPKLIIVDDSKELINKPYMIYEKIVGETLGHRWHLLNDTQRREIIQELCKHIKTVSLLDPNPQLESGKTWQEQVIDGVEKDLRVTAEKNLLSKSLQEQIRQFAEANKRVLAKENLALTYWDVNLDNVIVDKAGKMVGLVDFEHVEVVSIDFLLDIVRQMVRYPWLTSSKEMEKYARKEDYQYMMGWYKEFYPDLFDFPYLEKRLDFYELEGILRKLPRFPSALQLRERLGGILNPEGEGIKDSLSY